METHPQSFEGTLIFRNDPGFREAALGGLWNQLRPDRLPDVIAQVATVEDVVEAVRYAKRNSMKVAIRGGGHNWACPSLRNSGMMIDLTRLNNVVEIDAANRRAIVEPIISNREIQQILKPYNLAFPTGHCPTVKLSGYLLSGGMSWNHGVWGPGCGSVEAIEMVTADGELVMTSAAENADLFWAARGAGPGLCAVAVRYHLRLYPLPSAIACSSYAFPLEMCEEVAQWVGPLADSLTPNVELSLFMLNASQAPSVPTTSKIAMVTATVFADSTEEAEQALRPLEECPLMDRCLSRTFAEPSDFEGLSDLSGSLWPDGLRCKVDAMMTDQPLAEVAGSVSGLFQRVPSEKSVLMFAIYTGGEAPRLPEDAAFSVTGKLYGGPWTMWDDADQDAPNSAWHDQVMSELRPFMHGHYVSETDTVGHPEYLEKAWSSVNRAKLEAIRAQRDPAGLFFGYEDGLDPR